MGSRPADTFILDVAVHAQKHPSQSDSPQGMDEVELRELMQMEDSGSKTRDQEMDLLMISGSRQVVKVSFFIQEVPGLTDRAQGRRWGQGGPGSPLSPSLGQRHTGSRVHPELQQQLCAAARPTAPF